MPESLAIPRRDLADAERSFWDAAKKEHNTPRKVRQALGLPDTSGALEAWVDKHGWDAARKLLEDGKTVAKFGKTPPASGSPILRRDQGQELERLRDETGIDPDIIAATDYNKRVVELSESEAQAVIESLKQALAVEA